MSYLHLLKEIFLLSPINIQLVNHQPVQIVEPVKINQGNVFWNQNVTTQISQSFHGVTFRSVPESF